MTAWHVAGIAAGAAVGLGVALLILYAMLQRHPSWRHAHVQSPRAPDAPVRDDARRLMDELTRLAAQIDAKLNQRIGELEMALSRADEKLRHLRQPDEAPLGAPGRYDAVADPVNAEVIRLHRQGLDAIEIARRLEMDVGEVELVVNLHGAEASRDA